MSAHAPVQQYLRYSDSVETLDTDEPALHQQIVDLMLIGQHKVRSNTGHSVRISHAKPHGLLTGTLTIHPNLSPELAQGLFSSSSSSHPAIVRLSTAPGELTDDSKINTVRGMAIKVFNVQGPHLPVAGQVTTQDWVLDTGKTFINSNARAFYQTFKPNAQVVPHLSDTIKGAVSTMARGTNAALNAVGLNSEKLDFFGHQRRHPMDEAYFSQTALRYGDYIAKLAVIPANDELKAMRGAAYDPQTHDAMREQTVAYFRQHAAEWDVCIQLCTDLTRMPVEDAMAEWDETVSPYRPVARLTVPVQMAWDGAKDAAFDGLSFSPAHSLVAHRPLGSVNRARLAAYPALAEARRKENGWVTTEPSEPPATGMAGPATAATSSIVFTAVAPTVVQ